MKVFIDESSPLSFKTNTVIVQPINEWQFEVKINGATVGYIITRTNEWGIDVKGYAFTNEDKNILINAAKSLMAKQDKKSPKEASTIFHSIMKASVKSKESYPSETCPKCDAMADFIPPVVKDGKNLVVQYKYPNGHEFSKYLQPK
jgi:thiol-disulfide isomerase/thioredoxin